MSILGLIPNFAPQFQDNSITMKKIRIITFLLFACAHVCEAQSSYFNTIGAQTQCNERSTMKDSVTSVIPFDKQQEEEPPTVQQFLAGLSLQELEYLNDTFKVNTDKQHQSRKSKDAATLRFYEGEHRPLTVMNLLDVMKEVGISNRLFVLAQSLLETGYFTSNVCKTRNNLFGLYDSRHKCYYKFDSWESSVVGYYKFIQYRYKGGNYLSFLKRIGYAEDPKYISKVAKMSREINRSFSIID